MKKVMYFMVNTMLITLLSFGLSSCSKSDDEKEENAPSIEGIWKWEDPEETGVAAYLRFEKGGVGLSCDVRPLENPPIEFDSFKWSLKDNKLTVIFKDPETGMDETKVITVVKLDKEELVINDEQETLIFKRTDSMPMPTDTN